MKANEVGWVYSTMFSIPGMNEQVKVDAKISRKAVLLLSDVIERGLSKKEGEEKGILDLIPKESLEELRTFSDECLNKAGLKELSEQMKKIPNS